MVTVVVLSTADIDAPVWTNKQHLATRLAQEYDVIYVNSIGLRTPSLNRSDVNRILKRLVSRKKTAAPSAPQTPNRFTVVSPRVLPFHSISFVRHVNSRLLKRQIGGLLADTQASVLWTFSPITYGIESLFSATVYHSVDLLHEIAGIPRTPLLEGERALIPRCDRVIASSSGVESHLASQGASHVLVWENVADVDLYISTPGDRREMAIFAGNVTPGKVDFGILRRLAEQGLPLAIAGPISIDGSDARKEIDQILQYKNVTYHGNLTPRDLATVLNSATVGLIPYRQNPYTRGVFPMKVYEYLASGLAVISTPLPSLSGLSNDSIRVAGPEAFVDHVRRHLGLDDRAVQRRKSNSREHSWGTRFESAKALIDSLIEGQK